MIVSLRSVEEQDLPKLHQFHCQKAAMAMAVFGPAKPEPWSGFEARWKGLMQDPDISLRSILADDAVVGYIAHFDQFGRPSISYWLDQQAWGQGIASEALRQFLLRIANRPLFARAAITNTASIAVLTKNGFVKIAEEVSEAPRQSTPVVEAILRLDREAE